MRAPAAGGVQRDPPNPGPQLPLSASPGFRTGTAHAGYRARRGWKEHPDRGAGVSARPGSAGAKGCRRTASRRIPRPRVGTSGGRSGFRTGGRVRTSRGVPGSPPRRQRVRTLPIRGGSAGRRRRRIDTDGARDPESDARVARGRAAELLSGHAGTPSDDPGIEPPRIAHRAEQDPRGNGPLLQGTGPGKGLGYGNRPRSVEIGARNPAGFARDPSRDHGDQAHAGDRRHKDPPRCTGDATPEPAGPARKSAARRCIQPALGRLAAPARAGKALRKLALAVARRRARAGGRPSRPARSRPVRIPGTSLRRWPGSAVVDRLRRHPATARAHGARIHFHRRPDLPDRRP